MVKYSRRIILIFVDRGSACLRYIWISLQIKMNMMQIFVTGKPYGKKETQKNNYILVVHCTVKIL